MVLVKRREITMFEEGLQRNLEMLCDLFFISYPEKLNTFNTIIYMIPAKEQNR